MPDDVFEKYELVRRLGSGGMGEILLARQKGAAGADRNVIIKMILPHLAQDPEFIGRFTDETRIAALLSHGNIVTIFESGCWQGRFFMVMEYVDGPDLKELLSMAGPLRQSDRWVPFCVHVLSETARALAYAHSKRDQEGRPLGIVHRDVSPSNILISREGLVKLTDFGVAKAARRTSVTLPGKLHGKVNYMAPEQVRGMDCDHRSDIFSLGVTGYEMLAGVRPFEGDSDIAVLEQIRSMRFVPLDQAAPSVPPALAAIVARAMDADPAARWQSADEFLAALGAFAHQAGMSMMARDVAAMLAPLLTTTGDEVRANASIDDFLLDALNDLPGTPSGGIRISTGEVGGGSRERTVTVSREVTSPGSVKVTARDATAAAGFAEDGAAPDQSADGRTPERDAGLQSATGSDRRTSRGRAGLIAAGVAVVLLAAGYATWTAIERTPDVDGRPQTGAASAGRTDTSGTITPTPPDPAPTATAGQAKSQVGAAAIVPPSPTDSPSSKAGTPEPATAIDSNPGGARQVREGDKTVEASALTNATDASTGDMAVTRQTGRQNEKTPQLPGDAQRPQTTRTAAVTRTGPSDSSARADTGRAVFRFFPADAVVEIDGRRVATDGNLVELDLPAGSHTIAVSGPDGAHKRTRSFNIVAGGTLALGTIELESGTDSGR